MKFDKTKFSKFSDTLTYDGKFVARFKYSSRDVAGFKSFLTKNFEVEEYFSLIEELGFAPVTALEIKGYISTTVKNILKGRGFEPTIVGRELYLKSLRG